MRSKWLSVIVPSHNDERWLSEALQSVVDQGEPGIEVILVDSSDSEASLQVARRFADKLEIQIHSRSDILPWAAKVNFAVEITQADWFCILHVDDFWLPNRSAKLRELLSNAPDAVMHLHPSYIVDAAGKRLGIWRCPLPSNGSPIPTALLIERLLVQNFVAVPAPLLRRDTFRTVGGMDEALWHTGDWDLYLKMAGAGKVHYHADPLTCMRIHGNSLGMSGSRRIEDFREQHEVVIRRYCNSPAIQQRKKVLRLALASIDINVALAAANNGKVLALLDAVAAALRLGPRAITRYLHHSRIIERVMPRVRARLAGRL